MTKTIFDLTSIYFQILEELTARAIAKQKEDSSKGISSSLSGDSLEMAIRQILNPHSKNINNRMKNGSTDIFLIKQGILLEVKSACATISYTGNIKDSLKYSNYIAYVSEILPNSKLENEVRIIPKQDFLAFLFNNPSLFRVKKPTYAYRNAEYENARVLSMQSFYSEGRQRSSRKSRKLIDNFINSYPSFVEFCKIHNIG